jgi:hypothetical protein
MSERMSGVTVLAALGLMACGPGQGDNGADALAERQADVAAAGAEVMPFDLETSTHVFEKTDVGGVQEVASDTEDPEQIALIRAHLAEEAVRFSSGDFHDPAMIHGDDMPGLHALVMGHELIDVTYGDIESGGRIVYSTEDPSLVEAIHQWFEAQVRDHGEHAQAHR